MSSEFACVVFVCTHPLLHRTASGGVTEQVGCLSVLYFYASISATGAMPARMLSRRAGSCTL